MTYHTFGQRVYHFILRYSFEICFLLLVMYLSPYFILMKDTRVCLYDILEYLPMYKIVASRWDYLLAHNHFIIPNVMSGLPRVSYPSEMNIQVWLYYFFEPYIAYTINAVAVHLIAFFSARLFLKEQFIINKRLSFTESFVINEQNLIINLSALYFSLIPFWIYGGASISGMPLIFNAFLNIMNNRIKTRDVLFIIFYPFYSSFIFSNIFVILVLAMYYIYHTLKERTFNFKFLFFLIVFSLICILAEYRIILAVVDGFKSHRGSFVFSNETRMTLYVFIYRIVFTIINNFEFYIYSYSDSVTRHYPFLFFLSLFVIILSIVLRNKKVTFYLITLLFMTLIFSYLSPLKEYVIIVFNEFLPERLVGLIKGFSFRFYVLNPIIWLVILFITFCYLMYLYKSIRAIIVIIILSFNMYLMFTSDKCLNFPVSGSLEQPLFNNINKNIPVTYKSYFDVDLFERINQFIIKHYNLNKKDYRVMCITDLHPSYPLFSPAVLLYNNYQTIDGYSTYYPESYKKFFETIYTNKEMDINKNPGYYSLITYGNRVYFCIAATDININGQIEHLNINVDALKRVNCKFIFSRKEILNTDRNIQFAGYFEGIFWKIYLYKLN